jgi:hypothetical protein
MLRHFHAEQNMSTAYLHSHRRGATAGAPALRQCAVFLHQRRDDILVFVLRQERVHGRNL